MHQEYCYKSFLFIILSILLTLFCYAFNETWTPQHDTKDVHRNTKVNNYNLQRRRQHAPDSTNKNVKTPGDSFVVDLVSKILIGESENSMDYEKTIQIFCLLQSKIGSDHYKFPNLFGLREKCDPKVNNAASTMTSQAMRGAPFPWNQFVAHGVEMSTSESSNSKCLFSTSLPESSCINHLMPQWENSSRSLLMNEFICSNNKLYRFGMTMDKNLCLCGKDDEKIWCAQSCCSDGNSPYVLLQNNGNLVVNKDSEIEEMIPIWDTDTVMSRGGSNELHLRDNGALQLISTCDSDDLNWSVEVNSTYSPTASSLPTLAPTIAPTTQPSLSPTALPTLSIVPTIAPTVVPSVIPTSTPFIQPSLFSSSSPTFVSFLPGVLHDQTDLGIKLSQGLKARLIAQSNTTVLYANGNQSSISMHEQPDAGGCFSQPDGGWIYVSNSEIGDGDIADGGVGSFRFDKDGDLIDYRMVLTNTRMNCGGGPTPWGTWMSGEEFKGNVNNPNRLPGGIWEVDPTGNISGRKTVFGGDTGRKFESAICDDRAMINLKCFATIDMTEGELRRFTPNPSILSIAIISGDYSEVLHHMGIIDYLILKEDGTFEWTTDLSASQRNAELIYPNAEGIDAHDGILYFVSKEKKMLFILDLDAQTYEQHSTKSGSFQSQPDQIAHIIGDNPNSNSYLYLLEDGGDKCGVFARDLKENKYFSVLEKIADGSSEEETTGLAFCDHHKRMIVAFQESGKIFEITREDGLPFYGATVNIKYHDSQRSKISR